MTPEQEHVRNQVRRYVQREQLYAVMNDTKWKELIAAMRALPGGTPCYRIKDVLGPEPDHEPRDGEWYYHLWPYFSIEWIDIDPLCRKAFGPSVDKTAAIIAALKAASIPFSVENRFIRVWGYTRPGECVPFVQVVSTDQQPQTPSASDKPGG